MKAVAGIVACLVAICGPAMAKDVLLNCQGETSTVATKVTRPHVTNIPIAADGSWIGIVRAPRKQVQNQDVWHFRDEGDKRYNMIAEYTLDLNILSLFVAHSKRGQDGKENLEWVERVWCVPIQNPFQK